MVPANALNERVLVDGDSADELVEVEHVGAKVSGAGGTLKRSIVLAVLLSAAVMLGAACVFRVSAPAPAPTDDMPDDMLDDTEDDMEHDTPALLSKRTPAFIDLGKRSWKHGGSDDTKVDCSKEKGVKLEKQPNECHHKCSPCDTCWMQKGGKEELTFCTECEPYSDCKKAGKDGVEYWKEVSSKKTHICQCR